MCECFSLTFIDAILSFIIFGMNIIYVLWGWFTPNDPNRQDFQEQIQELKNYMNFVTYSDSLALFLKLFVLSIFVAVVYNARALASAQQTLKKYQTQSQVNIFLNSLISISFQ